MFLRCRIVVGTFGLGGVFIALKQGGFNWVFQTRKPLVSGQPIKKSG